MTEYVKFGKDEFGIWKPENLSPNMTFTDFEINEYGDDYSSWDNPDWCERVRICNILWPYYEELGVLAHIVIEDENVEDRNIQYCLDKIEQSDEPEHLKYMTRFFLLGLLSVEHDDDACPYCSMTDEESWRSNGRARNRECLDE